MSQLAYIDRAAVSLHAKPAFNDFLKGNVAGSLGKEIVKDPQLRQQLNDLMRHVIKDKDGKINIPTSSTIYLTPQLADVENCRNFLDAHIKEISNLEITTWFGIPTNTSDMTLDTLTEWFNVDVHPNVYAIMPIEEDKLYGSILDLHALHILPKRSVLDWLIKNNNKLKSPLTDIENYQLDLVRSFSPVYLCKPIQHKHDIHIYIQNHKETLIKNFFQHWCDDEKLWPVQNCLKDTSHWFDFNIHPYIYHIAN